MDSELVVRGKEVRRWEGGGWGDYGQDWQIYTDCIEF